VKKYIYGGILFIAIVIIAVILATPVRANDTQPELKLIDATAYYDSYGHGCGADGRKLIEGVTIAGKPEWLGMTAVLYDMDMRLIGIYEFRDTGYVQPTGYGKSKIIKGETVGTIENGTCVDIYMNTKAKCREWGRRKVYMQLIKAVG
jgi:3D (Asp-Asp-Asp) domain-containing protein